MFVIYDPDLRHLIETAAPSNEADWRATHEQMGTHFIEVVTLPAPFDELFVDEDGDLAYREALPDQPADMDFDVVSVVPEISLPEGGISTPPAGTPLASGETYVRLQAPGYLDHYFVIRVWTAEDVKRELVAFAANRRWELMQAGATWRGHRVATDDVSQSRMTSAILAAQIVANWQTTWQFADGSSEVVKAPEMTEIALTAQALVNKLFVTFDAIKVKIQSGEITTEAEITAAFDNS